MGLGNRNANARHGADSHSAYWLFNPGQRVMTCDGFVGRIARVEDGPHAGNETYYVDLDNSMGGGAYQPGQLTALRQETAEHHTAADDYPELATVLMERPDIAHNVLASKTEDHYMGTAECSEGDDPDFEEGHLTWGGQAAQGEGNDYSLFPVPRTAAGMYSSPEWNCHCGLECPSCGELDEGEEFANGEGHQCSNCGSNVWHGASCEHCDSHEHGTSDHERNDPDTVIPQDHREDGGYGDLKTPWHGPNYDAEDPFSARKAMLESRLGGEFNGIHECDHCGSAAHSTGEHGEASEREGEDRDYGQECDYCGADHPTSEHEDEPQEDDAFIHGDGSASMGRHHVSRPPYGHEAPHEYAHHAIEQEMQTSGYYPNIWDEHGNPCHEHHAESVASELKREHPMIGMHPPCPFCRSHDQQDASGHDGAPFDESKHGMQTEHLSRCRDCKAVYDPCEADETGHMEGADAPLEGKDPYEHAEHAVDEAFSGTHPAAYDLLSDNSTGPSRYSSLSVYSMLVDAAADPEFRFEITAAWSDVRNKAKRLRTTGQVTITAASEGVITGVIKGDHFTYETQIQRLPGHFGVATWQCGCKWAAYSWGRSPRYKHLEGRMCSHALALHYEAQSRGMFGKTIYEDTTRPTWLRANSPVVIEYERDRDRNLTRRAVPPGNMRSAWGAADNVRDVRTLDNPTGLGDEFTDETVENLLHSRPRQSAEDRGVNTPQSPGGDPMPRESMLQEAHCRPLGYTYDADVHCARCAEERFGEDNQGHVLSHAEDSEGNAPHPIFQWDETSSGGEHCGSCGATISEPWDDEGSGCPACGEHSDNCMGHGPMGDPHGHRILEQHEEGNHADCQPGADCDHEPDHESQPSVPQHPGEGTSKRGAMTVMENFARQQGHGNLDWRHTGEGHSTLHCHDCGATSKIVDFPGHGWDYTQADHVVRCPQSMPDTRSRDQQELNYAEHSRGTDPSHLNEDTAWRGPNYAAEDPFAPRRVKPEDADSTLDHIDRAIRGESALKIAIREALAQGEDPADIAMVMHTAQIQRVGLWFHADQQYEDDSMASDGGAGGDTGEEGFSPTLDAGDPTSGQPAALSVQDYDETSAGYKDGSSSYFGGGIGSTGAVTTTNVPQSSAPYGGVPSGPGGGSPETSSTLNSGDSQQQEMEQGDEAQENESGAYSNNRAQGTLNTAPEPALPMTDGDLDEENPIVDSMAPNGGEDDRTAALHYADRDPLDYGSEDTQHPEKKQDSGGGLPGIPKIPGLGGAGEAGAALEEAAPLLLAAAVSIPEEEVPAEEESAPELSDNAVAASLHYNQNVDSMWAIVEQFQRSASYLQPGAGSGGNLQDTDIAAAAREHLQKSALKDFTPGEQAALINEGEGVLAANLDRLKIEGTHYEALEAALAADDDPVGLFD